MLDFNFYNCGLVIVIAKTGLEKLSFDNIRDELEKIFVKSGLLK
jgi:hypothetical protein